MTNLRSLFLSRTVSLFLLLLALSSVFLFGNDRHAFYRPGHHSYSSLESLAVARNLSPHHNFLMFKRQLLTESGKPSYMPYNRFPIGGYALIKLAILPFAESLSAQIHVARIPMLLFFCAAAVLAYLSLCRLTPQPLIALTATLLAFSSYYSLYYNDLIYPAVTMGYLFGTLLVFHGMVLFVQDGRFLQLLVKVCVALLLGWPVYALLLPFIVGGVVRAIKEAPRSSRHSSIWTLCRCYVVLGGVSLLFGCVILTVNFTNEYHALNQRVGLTSLPSFVSMRYRLGADQEFNARHAQSLAWQPFLEEQFRRLGQMSFPYVVLETIGLLKDDGTLQGDGDEPWFVIIGIAMSGACGIGLARGRSRMLLTPLAVSGFCWSLPMRHLTVYHDFTVLSYIGLLLIFFSQVLRGMQWRFGTGLMAGLAVAAALGFVLSSLQMSRVGHDAEAAELSEKVVADFEVIRRLTKGKKVLNALQGYVHTHEQKMLVGYYLAESYVSDLHPGRTTRDHPVDFVLSRLQLEGANLLTPENRLVFLYEWEGFLEAYRSRSFGRLLASSNFDVYLDGTVLRYVTNPCSREDWNAPFFLHVTPVDVDDLPAFRRHHGFDNRGFLFGDFRYDTGLDGTCEAAIALQKYPIARITTGQHLPNSDERIWEETFSLADDPLSSAAAALGLVLSSLQMSRVGHDAEAAELSEKVVADFEVIRRLTKGKKVLNALQGYVHTHEQRMLVGHYLAESDVSDLRPGRTTRDHPVHFTLSRLQLEGSVTYTIERPGVDFVLSDLQLEGANLLTPENRLVFLYEWEGFLEAYRSRSFGRLLASSNFDVYLDGTVLRYVTNPCSREDWNAPFFLHVTPVDVDDLPAFRRQYGFENRDFFFGNSRQDLGMDRTCEAAVALPEYAIARIGTGQHIPNEGVIWTETFSLADEPLSSAGTESSPPGDHPRAAES